MIGTMNILREVNKMNNLEIYNELYKKINTFVFDTIYNKNNSEIKMKTMRNNDFIFVIVSDKYYTKIFVFDKDKLKLEFNFGSNNNEFINNIKEIIKMFGEQNNENN